MFELMDALDRVHLYPGQMLFCKNGDTVTVKEIVYNSAYIEYKGLMYIRKISEAYNRTLFESPFDNGKRYYDIFGFDESGYDKDGFDKDGFDSEGYDRDGFDRVGYTKDKYNRDGYNWYGYDRDGYDKEGYDKNGYDRDGFSQIGFDSEGFDRQGYDYNGYDRDGFDREGFNKKGCNRDGQLWIDVAKQLAEGEEKTINGKRCCNSGIFLRCKECKNDFLFTFGEYDFFKRKGFDAPKRCPHCREMKKRDREKYEGLFETMARNGSRKMTGRQMAYRYNPYIED